MCPFLRLPAIIYKPSCIDLMPKKRLPKRSLGRPDWARRAQYNSKKLVRTALAINAHNENNLIEMQTSSTTADSIIGSICTNVEARIIFLDVDGVLNHSSTTDDAIAVCPCCVGKLKSMIELTSAKIVLSSTWRLNKRHKKTLFRYLRAIEVDQGVVVGETRDLRSAKKTRAEEINDWLSHPKLYRTKSSISSMNLRQLVSNWVSLDDLDLANIQPNKNAKNKHIKLDPKLGLCGTESIIATVVNKLLKTRSWTQEYTSSTNREYCLFLPETKRSYKTNKESNTHFYDDG